MNQFSVRPVTIYELPVAADVPILKPEQAILLFAAAGTVDIGALCYLKRAATSSGNRKATEGGKVLLSSLCPERVRHVRAFITHISDVVRYSGQSIIGIHFKVAVFRRFMLWADGNGYSNVFDDAAKTRLAVRAFAAHLRERVTTHKISINFAAREQNQAFALLSEFLEIENLTRGINLLRMDSNATECTVPPDEADQGRVLGLCEALFNGLTTLVLEEKPYPFGVTMPSHLGYPEDIMWVFPNQVWCLPATRLGTHGTTANLIHGFNYWAGRLATREELMALHKYKGETHRKTSTRKRVTNTLWKTLNLLNIANSTPLHWHRRYMGMMAHNAFIPLFISRTGMNWEQTVDLPWSGIYKDNVSTLRQKFRSIKFRAAGKEVCYQLPLAFMPLFKRFLQLRDYLLQGYPDFDGLFFTKGVRATEPPALLKSALQDTFGMLQRIDPALTPVCSRGWRAAKSAWLIPRTDVLTTAQLLQNSESTVRQSYAAGSETEHLTEMSEFLNRMVVAKESVLDGSSVSAVGGCVSYGNPHEIPGVVALVAPNCQNPEVGCLFCDKCKVHADEIDVRKLLSCRYCLIRTSHLAGFHALSEPLIGRIQLILDAVNNRDASLVPRITKEVEEGELDPYWASKYDMLLRLRLVNDTD